MCETPTVNESAYLSAVMRDVQTEAFQGCQAHNSFVCYAIETSCSLLSQYLLPNGMCALLLPLINNTRLKGGLITLRLCLSTPCTIILCPSSSFPPSPLSYSPCRPILCFLSSPSRSRSFVTPCSSLSFPPLVCQSHIISLVSAPPLGMANKTLVETPYKALFGYCTKRRSLIR